MNLSEFLDAVGPSLTPDLDPDIAAELIAGRREPQTHEEKVFCEWRKIPT